MLKLPGLRLSPSGPYRAGDRFTASLTLTNYGDAPLDGAHLLFLVPSEIGVIHDESSLAGLDGKVVARPEHKNPKGALLPALAPGETLSLMLALLVRDARQDQRIVARLEIGNGEFAETPPAEISFQRESRVDVSPSVELVDDDPQSFDLKFSLSNSGSLADKVRLTIPIPDYLIAEGSDENQFLLNFGIEPGGSEEISLRLRVNDDFLGNDLVLNGITLETTSETREIEPLPISLQPHVDLQCTVSATSVKDPQHALRAGELIETRIEVRNNGRSDASNVGIDLDMNDAFTQDQPQHIDIENIPAHDTVQSISYATIRTPLPDQTPWKISAILSGQTTEASGLIASEPNFPLETNFIRRSEETSLRAGQSTHLQIRISNCGTDIARNASLRLDSSSLLVLECHRSDQDAHAPISVLHNIQSVDLGDIAAGQSINATLSVRAAESVFENGARFHLKAALLHDRANDAIDLGEVNFIGISAPHISDDSGFAKANEIAMSIGQERTFHLTLSNIGSSAARDMVADLHPSSEIEIVGVEGAVLNDGHLLFFKELPALSSISASIAIHLRDARSGNHTVEIPLTLHGRNLSRRALPALKISTSARALLQRPHIDMSREGEGWRVTASLYNDGDVAAIVAASAEIGEYLRGSTFLNRKPLRDIAGRSPLASRFSLPPTAPGTQLTLSWVQYGTRASLTIESNDQPPIVLQEMVPTEVPAPRLTDVEPENAQSEAPGPVLSETVLEEAAEPLEPIPETEPAAELTHAPADEESALNEPSNEPDASGDTIAPGPDESEAQGAEVDGEKAAVEEGEVESSHPIGVLSLTPERLERINSVMDRVTENDDMGAYRHIFLMRLFIPERLLGVSAGTAGAYDRILASVSSGFGALIPTLNPEFKPTHEWAAGLSNPQAERASMILINNIPEEIKLAQSFNAPAQRPGGFSVELDLSALAEYFSPNDTGTSGHLNAVLASLIVDHGEPTELATALAHYKEHLVKVFHTLGYAGPDVQFAQLSQENEDLDGAFIGVIEAFKSLEPPPQ